MILQLSNVQKSYFLKSETLSILKGIDLNIDRPQVISIVGQSGSGKTTLLSLLSGLDRADAGDIEINNIKLSSLDDKKLCEFRARNIALVFQQYHLINFLTAIENVELSMNILNIPDAKKKAKELLIELNLEERINHFPSELSGGECQRVAIARAMAQDAPLILADEPSGNLDIATGRDVMNKLFDLVRKKSKTMILVTHNLELAKLCDKQYRLENGKLIQ